MDTSFTRQQLKQMPVILAGLALTEHAGPDGKPLVVDVLEGPGFWIQCSRDFPLYRFADRKRAAARYSEWWSAE